MKNRAMPGPAPGPKVSGGAVPRVTAAPIAPTSQGRPVTVPRAPAVPSMGAHISREVRSDLGKIDPSIAAEVRRVADSK
jgi:hypothetical protein